MSDQALSKIQAVSDYVASHPEPRTAEPNVVPDRLSFGRDSQHRHETSEELRKPNCDAIKLARYGGGKYEWPELVGSSGEEAVRKIREERPGLQEVRIIAPDDVFGAVEDVRDDRVRVQVDASGTVVATPYID